MTLKSSVSKSFKISMKSQHFSWNILGFNKIINREGKKSLINKPCYCPQLRQRPSFTFVCLTALHQSSCMALTSFLDPTNLTVHKYLAVESWVRAEVSKSYSRSLILRINAWDNALKQSFSKINRGINFTCCKLETRRSNHDPFSKHSILK